MRKAIIIIAKPLDRWRPLFPAMSTIMPRFFFSVCFFQVYFLAGVDSFVYCDRIECPFPLPCTFCLLFFCTFIVWSNNIMTWYDSMSRVFSCFLELNWAKPRGCPTIICWIRVTLFSGFFLLFLLQQQLKRFQANPQFGLYLSHMMAYPSAQVTGRICVCVCVCHL